VTEIIEVTGKIEIKKELNVMIKSRTEVTKKVETIGKTKRMTVMTAKIQKNKVVK